MNLKKNKSIDNYTKYKKIIKAKRIIYNRSSNDFNREPEYKLQKVRIYGEVQSVKNGECYVIDSYGNFKSLCNKTQVFLNQEDLKNKIDNIKDFRLTENEKQYLLEQIM